MSRPWQRLLGVIAGCGAALLLAGCEVTGSLEVRSESEVIADLVITGAEPDCMGIDDLYGITITGTPEAGGGQVCRARGPVDPEQWAGLGVQVTRIGEYLIVDLDLPRRFGDVPLDLDLKFPGAVVDPGMTVASGNQVSLDQGAGVGTRYATRVVALAHPGPPWWVLGSLAGLITGAGAVLAGLLLVRRRRRARAAELDAGSIEGPDPRSEPAVLPVDSVDTDFARPQQAAPWPDRDPGWEAMFAPPGPPSSGWGPPDPATRHTADADGPPDHSIWGPPEDREQPID